MAFVFQQKMLFKHCDPAGIVFYPRYFEILNDCVEAFFDEKLQHPFEELHKYGGVPTAEISTKFIAPSRHGDRLDIKLDCSKIGGASLALKFYGHCGTELRFTASSVLVYVGPNGRPKNWPDSLRGAIENFMMGQD